MLSKVSDLLDYGWKYIIEYNIAITCVHSPSKKLDVYTGNKLESDSPVIWTHALQTVFEVMVVFRKGYTSKCPQGVRVICTTDPVEHLCTNNCVRSSSTWQMRVWTMPY